MKPAEAATRLGIDKRHVRLLIRTGKLKATKKVVKYPKGKKLKEAYYWDISEAEVRKFSLVTQVTGRPRGSVKPKPVLHLARPAGYRDTSILSQHIGRKGSNRVKSRSPGRKVLSGQD